MNERIENLYIENAKIINKDFSGMKWGNGKRTFGVIIEDPEVAQQLNDIGWQIKVREPRDENSLPTHWIKVEARFDNYPPTVMSIEGNKKVPISENRLGSLDRVHITSADVIISPSRWESALGSGIKAYLKTMYVTIESNPIDAKYRDYEYVE